MTRGLLLLLLVGCGPEPAASGARTVQVQVIEVDLTLDPEPTEVTVADPDWLSFHHCGRMSLVEDELHVYGTLEPEITAVALLRYGGWGSLFSGGGTTELELDLTSPVEIVAALAPDRLLYTLDVEAEDTGVPGGERTWSYGPNEFSTDTTAYELHQRWPLVEATVVELDPQYCAR